ncbi:hypothetical protein B0F90DRAFT_1738127 [Multifurca ochricompacta]|uniref:DUF6697 domain-containing protein n=1 Tax=Multifurca ochricompacta TaxID=376703 RepID=A0AAD4M176_9AGAM|nr:hypothetical protein B0F90DRAFT_1738127 [Multifurca ochricompacta]
MKMRHACRRRRWTERDCATKSYRSNETRKNSELSSLARFYGRSQVESLKMPTVPLLPRLYLRPLRRRVPLVRNSIHRPVIQREMRIRQMCLKIVKKVQGLTPCCNPKFSRMGPCRLLAADDQGLVIVATRSPVRQSLAFEGVIRHRNENWHGEEHGLLPLVSHLLTRMHRRASRVTNRRKKRKRNANVQRIGRATSTTPSAHSDNTSGFHDPTAIQSLLRRAGLEPLELASCETARAEETPGINWPTFWRTFGGQPKSRDEWLYCCKIPSHKWFFRGNASAQPYGPTSPGQPGLLLIAPATIDAPRGDQDSSLHLFMSQRTGRESTARLHYRGEYTRTRLPELQPIWHDLPLRCRQTWVRRFTVSWDPAIRALRARIRLRNELEREPSVGEIQAYVEGTNEGYDVSYKDISAAFQEGKENMRFEGFQCVGYDLNLATIIKQNVVDA